MLTRMIIPENHFIVFTNERLIFVLLAAADDCAVVDWADIEDSVKCKVARIVVPLGGGLDYLVAILNITKVKWFYNLRDGLLLIDDWLVHLEVKSVPTNVVNGLPQIKVHISGGYDAFFKVPLII